MVEVRVIPCLLVAGTTLVKTVQFRKSAYIGDPLNTARIFNELEADELIVLDITATIEGRPPNLELIRGLANECFMPLTYGGGIRDLATAAEIMGIGVEKVAVNSAPFGDPSLVSDLADRFGSQAVVGAIDAKTKWVKRTRACGRSGRFFSSHSPSEWAMELERRGAGELLLTSIDREGTWKGFDIGLVRSVVDSVGIPVIAHGGAATLSDIGRVVHEGGASAVGLGSMVVYQGPGRGVLVNFPDRGALEEILRPLPEAS